jgi:hypothetical protein
MPQSTALLVSKLAKVFTNYLRNERRREIAARQEREPRPHVEDTIAAHNDLSPKRGISGVTKVVDRAGNAIGVGVWDGDVRTAVRIPDSEFHTSLHSPTYQNWVRSRDLVEQVRREREQAWTKRKAELKARGLR